MAVAGKYSYDPKTGNPDAFKIYNIVSCIQMANKFKYWPHGSGLRIFVRFQAGFRMLSLVTKWAIQILDISRLDPLTMEH